MCNATKDIARKFFAALSAGEWDEKAKHQGGVQLLGSTFEDGLSYMVESLPPATKPRLSALCIRAGMPALMQKEPAFLAMTRPEQGPGSGLGRTPPIAGENLGTQIKQHLDL